MCFKKWNLYKLFMAKAMPWVLIVFGSLFAPLALSADEQKTYVANAIEGWVVEAGSKSPLEGVIAVMNWELVDPTNLPTGQLMVIETVTDQKGYFVFPAWGPKPRPPKSALDQKAPRLLLFKQGFQYRQLASQTNVETSSSAALDFDWNGKTFEMRRLPNDVVVNLGPGRVVSKRSLSLNGLSLSLGWAYQGKDCEWKQAPRMLAAIHRTKLGLDRQGLRTDLKSIDDLPRSDKCGSPRDYLRNYLP
jgi:hypothetical protein